jgi:outer membrane murein-binding lipoprotein Lpp
MSLRRPSKTTPSIRTYFRTRASSQLTEKDCSSDDDMPTEATQSKMAADNAGAGEGQDGAMAEVLTLIKGLDAKANSLDAKVTTGFSSLNENMAKLTDKVEALEFDVDAVKSTQAQNDKRMQRMQEEMDVLKRSLLSTQAYARKYHLLLYGVDGQDRTPKDTIERVRTFAKNSLKLDENYANKIVIRNAHRLQNRQDGGPATIVIVFLYWSEREAFLRAGPNLRGSKMSVRTDLPPELKQLRGRLASEAYDIRQNEHIHARIREKGADVWIETRKDSSSPWSRRQC